MVVLGPGCTFKAPASECFKSTAGPTPHELILLLLETQASAASANSCRVLPAWGGWGTTQGEEATFQVDDLRSFVKSKQAGTGES